MKKKLSKGVHVAPNSMVGPMRPDEYHINKMKINLTHVFCITKPLNANYIKIQPTFHLTQAHNMGNHVVESFT
jgi:hypothetical protein